MLRGVMAALASVMLLMSLGCSRDLGWSHDCGGVLDDYTRVRPVRLIAERDRYLLVVSRYHHENDRYGDILFMPLSLTGSPTQRATVVARSPESVGLVDVEPIDDRYVVAHTPGAVGGRSVRVFRVSNNRDGFNVGPVSVIANAPGNPFFLAMTRWPQGGRHGHIVLFHSGDDSDPRLRLSWISDHGEPVGPSLPVIGTTARSTVVDVRTTDGGLEALWRHEEDGTYKAVVDAFDGERFERHEQAIDGVFDDARVRADTLELVYHDNSGGLPGETMGLRLTQLGATSDTPLVPPRYVSSAHDADDPHFGHATWSGEHLGALFEARRGTELWLSIDRGAPVLLSDRYEGGATLHADDTRFFVAWTERDGTLGVAVYTSEGSPVLAPTRVQL